MLRPGDTIEYLADVSSPPNQKGIRGQTKVIDRDIPMWTARFLLRGGKVRPFDPASPLQIETEEGPETSTKASPPHGRQAKSAVADKKERRTRTNGRGKTISKTDQEGDTGPEKPDPKRRTGSSRG